VFLFTQFVLVDSFSRDCFHWPGWKKVKNKNSSDGFFFKKIIYFCRPENKRDISDDKENISTLGKKKKK